MMRPAFRKRVDAICEPLPGAEVSDPWGGGHDAWKVGGKMFASIGAVTKGVSVKCDDIETAMLLQENGFAERAPYFHKSWVLLSEETETDELTFRITRSYDLVRSKLTKKLRDALPLREEISGV